MPDDRSHLVSQTLSKALSQARVLPSEGNPSDEGLSLGKPESGSPPRIFTVQIYIGGFIP